MTLFKKISEYIISGIMLINIVFLFINRKFFQKQTYLILIASFLVMIFSESFFTLYLNVNDYMNFFGHYFKVLSFFLLYKAMIEINLNNPYETLFYQLDQSNTTLIQKNLELINLNKKLEHIIHREKKIVKELAGEKDRAQTYFDIAGVILVVLDVNGYIKQINKEGCLLLGYEKEDIINKDWFASFIPPDIQQENKLLFLNMINGTGNFSGQFENRIVGKSCEERIIAWHNVILSDEPGKITGILNSGLDITERRLSEYKLKAYNNKINFEMKFASTLQKSFEIPEKIEKKNFSIYSKYIHCEEMAGDFLDAIHLDNHVYIFSADVSGHGLMASLFIFIMKAIIKTVLTEQIPAGQLMSLIGNDMKKYLIEDYFVTMIILDIDLNNDKLYYAHAGHPPFIIYNDYEVRLITVRSSFISNLIPEHWENNEIELYKGDKILLFTDGVFEIEKEDNTLLGVHYIMEFVKNNRNLNPADLIRDLIRNIKKSGNREYFDDDISICIFKRN